MSLGHPRGKALAKEGNQKEKTMQEQSQHLFVGVWDMTPLLKKHLSKEETDCKAFAVTGQSDGTNTRAFQIGSGLCSLHSTLLISTRWLCAQVTVLRTGTSTIQSHRRCPTRTLF